MGLPTYSAIEVFVSVQGRTFTKDELGLFRLVVKDEDHGDNLVELHCVDDDYKIADGLLFQPKQILSVKWGYVGGPLSEERSGYVIQKPSTHYTRDGVISIIKAFTKTSTLHAKRPQKVYGNTTVRAIVQDIANRSGLKLVIQGGEEKLDGYSQANSSDRETLRILADRFGYQVSCVGETITFVPLPKDYNSDPVTLLTYRKGERSSVIEAELRVDSHTDAGAGTLATVASVDPKKKVSTVISDNVDKGAHIAISAVDGNSWKAMAAPPKPKTESTTQGFNNPTGSIKEIVQESVASFAPAANANSALGGNGSEGLAEDIRHFLSIPSTMNGTSQEIANSLRIKGQKRRAQFEITTPGNPLLTVRQLITVEGFAQRDNGNWYISEVEHRIDMSSGYECRLGLNRDGSNRKGSGKSQSNVNTKKATDDQNKTVSKRVEVSAITGEHS